MDEVAGDDEFPAVPLCSFPQRRERDVGLHGADELGRQRGKGRVLEADEVGRVAV